MEDENRRLKHLVADLSLHQEVRMRLIKTASGACRNFYTFKFRFISFFDILTFLSIASQSRE